jgi:L-lactate utilization protein LutC
VLDSFPKFCSRCPREKFSCKTIPRCAGYRNDDRIECAAGRFAGRVKARLAEASQATVTLAEALIAQTGSILVTASCGGRGASVIAPCHIVYATTGQLVPDLTTALSRASQERILDRNSFACVISGSSRTADIEKILVQGAHGPRRLVVILQGER